MCSILSGSSPTPFEEVLPWMDTGRQILRRVPSSALIADVAPVGSGHCLVVPNRHVLSIAQVAASELREVISLANLAAGVISRSYSCPPVFFEHGQCTDSMDPDTCSVAHAHLHVVADTNNAFADILSHFEFDLIQGLNDLRERVTGESGYLFVASERSAVAVGGTYPGQILRRIVAQSNYGDKTLWNWRDMLLLASKDHVAARILDTLAVFEDTMQRTGELCSDIAWLR